ncbi:hypothetical protein NPIL_108021 [Nephila pilipes]|uniref:Uncharacterized protein n=1 Tax=Nephila pilipes TaxID=299642 RepID=A0A8X6J050_NEPPI|nr:hypothetical protein NPIL_108021 [Nephila pilipes]
MLEDNIRCSLPSGPKRHVKASETLNDGNQENLGNLNAFQKMNIRMLFQMSDPFSNVMVVGDQGWGSSRGVVGSSSLG